MKKVKNLIEKVAGKAESGCKKVAKFGYGLVGAIVGAIVLTAVVMLILAGALAVACGLLTIVACAAVFLAHILGLSTGWAIAFFLAMIWLFWRK
ncbi:hypothetical protein SELR_pSRC400490 (plasmid) [Selenomonas ruminantium subsp. lactilytica TAM6421]|uniref:Holin-X, holin superfamily III n=1 Tax=Selenomonas ruminantium subsp. lactilytica (strain NBRC 103574 / TAM6421) TaxID=927704 RepID=I0GVB3_SELRL|nr:hypothetical protein [Selenomonas ruminantium]BAL84700.1 hypothetical protein SELR_pSRC400490 [Selenomonas ruminantium subsp. lactilytica TAM6421]